MHASFIGFCWMKRGAILERLAGKLRWSIGKKEIEIDSMGWKVLLMTSGQAWSKKGLGGI